MLVFLALFAHPVWMIERQLAAAAGAFADV